MSNSDLSLFLVVALLGFQVFNCNGVPRHAYMGNSKLNVKQQVEKVCAANIHVSDEELQKFLDYACSKYDCSPIQPGGQCFNPNTVFHHASFALNLEYKATGKCNSKLGDIITNYPIPLVLKWNRVLCRQAKFNVPKQ
ncbi:hypothetical protein CASFOL_035589 [Castilleja foliolosa]|uniref:X8 domain-containing protein n=1 Tax=Castilleja foliolosa TaxID=1961234 RepID=A0ABD3BTT1_9LAMI